MDYKSDIEIAQEAEQSMHDIHEISEKLGIPDRYLECYGKYKAKVNYNLLLEPG